MKWQEPPACKRGGGSGYARHLEEAKELRENPKRWALFASGTERTVLQSKANQIKMARLAAFRPSGTYEATVRVLDNGEFGLFVRYTGEQS